MEAAIKDFIEWMQTLPTNEVKYYAVFEASTGEVSGIYPDHSCPETACKIEVEEEIAQSVLEGRTQLSSYIVNTEDSCLEIVENKSLTKIDDVLHRIVDSKWIEVDDPDITIAVSKASKKIKLTLSDKFYKSRKIYWDGNTEMLFLVTDYNDPNGLHGLFSTTITKLFDSKIVEFDVELPDDFSIYTRRLFKKYVMIYEDN